MESGRAARNAGSMLARLGVACTVAPPPACMLVGEVEVAVVARGDSIGAPLVDGEVDGESIGAPLVDGDKRGVVFEVAGVRMIAFNAPDGVNTDVTSATRPGGMLTGGGLSPRMAWILPEPEVAVAPNKLCSVVSVAPCTVVLLGTRMPEA